MKQYIILGLLLMLSLFMIGCSEEKYTPPASNEAVGGGCGLAQIETKIPIHYFTGSEL